MNDGRLYIEARAKVNLYLEILGVRADGFHEIESLMAPVSLHDRIWLTPTNGGVDLSCPSMPDLPIEKNLSYKAASAFLKAAAIGKGVFIEVEKNIPDGAGLGGGSSDAAAVLKGMSLLFPESVSAENILKAAASIGSDVPFFLGDGAAWVRGRGEKIKAAIGLRGPVPAVLVYPGFAVSTAWAYSEYDRVSDSLTSILESARNPPPPGAACLHGTGLYNTFEKCVFSARPMLGAIKSGLLEAGARGALMSGSGSTVFGLFDSGEAADRAAAVMRKLSEVWRVFRVDVLP